MMEQARVFIAEGPRLVLRKMTIDDSEMIVRWRNQDWVRQNYIYRELFTLEGQMQYFRSRVETGEVVQLIACEKEPCLRPVGCTVLNDFHGGHGEYGMFLGEKDAAGRGYSSEMVRLTLGYGFDTLGLDEIVCRIFTDNTASVRGCERGGFAVAETLKDVRCSDGTVKDMYLLRAEKDTFHEQQHF